MNNNPSKLNFICFLWVPFFFFNLTVWANEPNQNSLVEISDTTFINNLNKEARNFVSSHTDSAEILSQHAFMLSEKLDYSIGKGRSLIVQGKTSNRRGQNSKALVKYLNALEIFIKYSDSLGMADAYNGIGGVYYDHKDLERAAIYFQKYLDISEATGDPGHSALANNNLGSVFDEQKDFQKALFYYTKAGDGWEKMGDKRGMAHSWTNLGMIQASLNNFEKAIEFQNKALVLRQEMGDWVFESLNLSNLGELYFKMGNLERAQNYYLKALQLSTTKRYSEITKQAYRQLALLNEKKKNFNDAYYYYQKYTEIKDSIFSEQSVNSMAEITTRFETTKKERAILRLQVQKQKSELESIRKNEVIERKNQQLIFVVAIFVFLTLASYILFIRYKFRQQKIKDDAIFDAEKSERLRISRDMHDELGAGLTRILYISDSASHPSNSREKLILDIGQIATSVRTLVDNIGDLIWTLNPENGIMDNLASKMREYINDVSDYSDIKFAIHFPDEIPAWPITREAKKNIYLFAKEAVNNAVKHSGAQEISVSLIINQTDLSLIVSDNGKGIDPNQKRKSGNGMNNMRKRVEEIGGMFESNSGPAGKGTSISMRTNWKKIRLLT